MARQEAMSRSELLALPTVVPLWPDAARAMGVGRTRAYEMVRSGEWPTRVLRLGSLIKVPSGELLRVLAVEADDDRAGAAAS